MTRKKWKTTAALAILGLWAVGLSISFAVVAPAKAATYEILHSFCGRIHGKYTCADGGDPAPLGQLIVDSSGDVFGATASGGSPLGSSGVSFCSQPATGCGAIFKLSPDGDHWADTVIYSFCALSSCQDGAYPAGLVAGSNGSFYGVTTQGGNAFWQAGTIFVLNPSAPALASVEPSRAPLVSAVTPAYSLINIYSSNNLSIGLTNPPSIDPAGDVFVATSGGGAGGTLLEVAAGTLSASTIYSGFCSVNTPERSCADGANPNGPLLAISNGALYGTTSYGDGGIYELTSAAGGWSEQQIFSLCGLGTGPCTSLPNQMGTPPNPGLVADAAGNLYGTTWRGGKGAAKSGCYLGWCGGIVFELSYDAKTKSWIEKNLYNFCEAPNCQTGADPASGLVIDAKGNLYGTTEVGGLLKQGCASFKEGIAGGCGVVFELSPPALGSSSTAWTYTVLHLFCQGNGTTCADGANPTAPLTLGPDGALYGTAAGGKYGHGLVFKLTP